MTGPLAGDSVVRMTRDDLLDLLATLLPSQLELLIFKLGAPAQHISGPQTPTAVRSIEVLLWAEQQNRMADLERLLGQMVRPRSEVLRRPERAVMEVEMTKECMHVLHLSDIHILEESQSILWYSQLAADLRELECDRLEALVVSGDIANHATPEEYRAASVLLKKIMSGFGLGPRQVIIVPGNHDLNWQASRDSYSLQKRVRYNGALDEGTYIEHGKEMLEVRDEAAYRLRFQNFADFYQRVKAEPYPLDPEAQATIHELPEHGLLFLGLNSAWQIDHHFRARASILPNALALGLDSLGRAPGLRIAVWHHPVHSISEDRIRDLGFLQRLAVAGFRVGLHGHIHRSDNHLYRHDMSPGGLNLVAAGTFGAPTKDWVPGYPLQYNLLRFCPPGKLTVETRKREELNGAWAPDARWLQGKGADPLPRYVIEL